MGQGLERQKRLRKMVRDLLNAAADYAELAGMIPLGARIRKIAHGLEEGFNA